MPVIVHVYRRHRHDRDHHGLRQHHHEGAEEDAVTDLAGCRWRHRNRQVGGRGRCLLAGGHLTRVQQWVRAQPRDEHDGGRDVRDGRQDERPGQVRYADHLGQVAGRTGQQRTDDAAHRGGHEHPRDRPGAVVRFREVGAGVARLQVGGAPCAVDEERGEQQDRAVQHRRDDHSRTAQRPHGIAGGEARTPPVRLRDPADGHCGERAAGGEQRTGESREPGAAEHVLGEQRAHGDPGGEAGAAEDLGHHQDAQSPALELRSGGHRAPSQTGVRSALRRAPAGPGSGKVATPGRVRDAPSRTAWWRGCRSVPARCRRPAPG